MIYIVGTANPTLRDPDGTGAEAFLTGAEKGRTITKFYRNKGNAERAAKELAKKYTGELFAVFSITDLYEAKAPEIMEKVLTENGEIVPKG